MSEVVERKECIEVLRGGHLAVRLYKNGDPTHDEPLLDSARRIAAL